MTPAPPPRRIAADSGQGLGELVIAVLEIVRDLLERQALRRVEGGSLSPDEVERLGQALIGLDRQFAELREVLTNRRGEGHRTGTGTETH